MHSSSAVTILCFGLFTGSLAACPPFAAVTNLDIPQQIGDWGIHGVVLGQGELPSLQCFHIEFSGTQFTQEPVDLDAVTAWTYVDTGASVTGEYAVTIPNLSRPGKWQVNMNGTAYDLTILNTDYVQYCLLALCAPSTSDVKVLLAARSHDQMPVEIANGYLQLLSIQYSIDISKYYQVTHGHACHMKR